MHLALPDHPAPTTRPRVQRHPFSDALGLLFAIRMRRLMTDAAERARGGPMTMDDWFLTDCSPVAPRAIAG